MNSALQRELARRLYLACDDRGVCVEKGMGSGPNIVWIEGSWMEALAILTLHGFRFTTFEPAQGRIVGSIGSAEDGMYLAANAESRGPRE